MGLSGTVSKFVATEIRPHQVLVFFVWHKSSLNQFCFFFFILKVNDSNAVNQAMNHIFALLDINDKLRQIYGERVLDVFIYDSVPKQRETLRKICTFLEIYCDDTFSSGIETLFGDDITSRPRDQVEWREEDKDLIENYMKKFDFLQPFSFDSSY